MESNTRYSTYSLTADRIPDWLTDEPFSFDDVLTPPSYLIASLQEAFDDHSYDQAPPTYDHSVGASTDNLQYGVPGARESIWEEDEVVSENVSEEGDSHVEENDDKEASSSVAVVNPRYAGVWSTAFERMPGEHESASTPTASSSSRSSVPSFIPHADHHIRPEVDPALAHALASAYHLLHLQDLSRAGLSEDRNSNLDLCASLAALDPQLLLTPFTAFADVCYHESVLGDTSPPTLRPFSMVERKARPLSRIPEVPSISHTHVVEDDEDTDDDDPMPTSPTQTFVSPTSPPHIWDPKNEEHSHSRPELPIRLPRSISSPCFLPPHDVPSSPLSERSQPQSKYEPPDTMAEIAALFLRGPIQATSTGGVDASPTRDEAEKSKRAWRSRANTSSVKGLFLRSLNISHWQPR